MGSPYSITASGAVDPDYTIGYVAGTLTVAPATPTVSVSDASGVYSGQPFSAVAAVAGVDSNPVSALEGVSPTLAYYAGSLTAEELATATPLLGTPENVGIYTVVASFPGSADYSGADGAPLTFIINAPLVAGSLTPPVATAQVPFADAVLFQFSDGDPNATAGDFTATITWRDGTTSTVTGSPRRGGHDRGRRPGWVRRARLLYVHGGPRGGHLQRAGGRRRWGEHGRQCERFRRRRSEFQRSVGHLPGERQLHDGRTGDR